jgi:hypothetical protein
MHSANFHWKADEPPAWMPAIGLDDFDGVFGVERAFQHDRVNATERKIRIK